MTSSTLRNKADDDYFIGLADASGYRVVGGSGPGACRAYEPYRWRLADMRDEIATRLEGKNEFRSLRLAKIALGKAILDTWDKSDDC